jgi:hypothetical protein
MQSRRNSAVGVNPITAKNKAIVTFHLDNKEHSSEQLAPHGELHEDDASGLHRVAPTPLSARLVFTSLSPPVTPRVSKPHDYANHMFMRL